MKRSRWVFLAAEAALRVAPGRTFPMRWLRCLLALCALWLLVNDASAAIIVIDQTQQVWSAVRPTVNQPGEPLQLPAQWRGQPNGALQPQWIRASFNLKEVPDGGLSLYIASNLNGGYFYLNGMRVAGLKPQSENDFIRWRRPALIELPYGFLIPGQNELLMQTSFREGSNRLSTWQVGRLDELQGRYERNFFIAHTVPRMVMSVCLVGGLFMLWFWWQRRDETLYGLVGMGSLFWSLRMLNFVIESTGLEWRPFVRLATYAGTGGFMVCALLAILRISGVRLRRFERLAVIYAFAGPAVYMLFQSSIETVIDSYWIGGLLLMVGVSIAVLLWKTAQRRTSEMIGVTIVVGVSLLMAACDWLIQIGLLKLEIPFLTHFVAPMLLIVIFGVIMNRFISLLQANENLNRDLIDKLAAREAELGSKYSEQYEMEQRRITLEERARIMQDMHDGLGSQLLSSLVMVERSEVSKTEVVGILRDALDDLRLAIDAFSPEGAELLPALGNLRFRMQGRFKAAKVPLTWNMVNVPDTFALPATATLPILRVLQESLTNILKHSHATEARVYVTTRSPPLTLVIEIHDNGTGFDTKAAPTRGRGLPNLQKRANRIGGKLDVASGPEGTRITLLVPLTT